MLEVEGPVDSIKPVLDGETSQPIQVGDEIAHGQFRFDGGDRRGGINGIKHLSNTEFANGQNLCG